jgi:hypothetical protein
MQRRMRGVRCGTSIEQAPRQNPEGEGVIGNCYAPKGLQVGHVLDIQLDDDRWVPATVTEIIEDNGRNWANFETIEEEQP